MKVWLLDNGSIVIEHTQLMWNVPGPQVRIPVYSVLDRARRRALPLRHRHRPRPHERVLPVRAAGADARADDPAPARARRLHSSRDVTTLVNSHLHFDHVGGNQHFRHGRQATCCTSRSWRRRATTSRSSSSATPTRSWDYEGANFEPVSGDLELAKGLWLFETPGPHGRPLLAARRARVGREADALRHATSSTRRPALEKGDPARLPQSILGRASARSRG